MRHTGPEDLSIRRGADRRFRLATVVLAAAAISLAHGASLALGATPDPVTAWSGFSAIPGFVESTTQAASAAAVKQLFTVVRSSDDRRLYLSSRQASSGQWSAWSEVVGLETDVAPALVAHRRKLYLFATSAADQRIRMNVYDPAVGLWQGWQNASGRAATTKAVSATAFRGKVYLAAHLDAQGGGLSVRAFQPSRGKRSTTHSQTCRSPLSAPPMG